MALTWPIAPPVPTSHHSIAHVDFNDISTLDETFRDIHETKLRITERLILYVINPRLNLHRFAVDANCSDAIVCQESTEQLHRGEIVAFQIKFRLKRVDGIRRGRLPVRDGYPLRCFADR